MSPATKVLVVDDDIDFMDAVKLTLETAGYQVITAHSGAEALTRLHEDPIDIAILDMMMEEPDAGARVALTLRRQPEMKNIPVLLVTSISEKTGYRPSASSVNPREWLGVDAWLDKPVDPKLLLDTIERLTRRNE